MAAIAIEPADEMTASVYHGAMRAVSSGLLTLLLLVACSDASEETASTAAGGSSSTSTSAGGSGGSGGSGASAAGPWAVLQVLNASSGMSTSHFVSALFSNTPVEGSSCTSEDHGSCYVSHCDGSTSTVPPSVYAGDVTVGSSLNTLMMTWADSSYTSVSGQNIFYADGDTIIFSVSGSPDFPGFDESLSAASPTEIDANGLVPIVHTSQPYTLDWTVTGAAPQGEFFFRMTTTRTVDGVAVERVSFYCAVPVTDGSVTVPLAVTSQLLVTGEVGCPGAGCEMTTAQVGRSAFTEKLLDVDGHSILLTAGWGPTFVGTAPATWTVEP